MKNILIAALVGISFLTSGFWVGMRLAPMPKKTAPVAVKAVPKPVDPKVAFSIDALKRTSENIATVNEALQAREQAVSVREKKAAQKEEEMAAERSALDRLHAHFKQLYGEFQKRLQLVTDTETGALQRQVVIYGSMDPAQAVDLIRSLDDSTVTRLFVLMEDKELGKIVGAWKQKYPSETPRLLTDLNGMGRVVAKDKMRLPDAAPDTESNTPAPPASTDVSTPAGVPASDTSSAAQTAAPDAASTPTAADSTAAAPGADTSASSAGALDATTPSTPASVSDASATGPVSEADKPAPSPASTAAPSDSSSAAPATAAPETAPAPSTSAPTAAPSSASNATDSSLLSSPGETAEKASASMHGAPGNQDAAPAPAQFTPPTPTLRLTHDKPARFASTRNND